MSLKPTYELFFSTFHINWSSKREDDKDYTFDYLCNLMARAWERLFEEGNLSDNANPISLKGRENKTIKNRPKNKSRKKAWMNL